VIRTSRLLVLLVLLVLVLLVLLVLVLLVLVLLVLLVLLVASQPIVVFWALVLLHTDHSVTRPGFCLLWTVL
jgi:hypothetical protein